MQTFGEALAAEMDAHAQTALVAATLAGLARSTLSHYLKGSRRPDMVALARLVRVYPRLLIWFVLFTMELPTAEAPSEAETREHEAFDDDLPAD